MNAQENAELVRLVFGNVPIDGHEWEIRVRVNTKDNRIEVHPTVKLHAMVDGEPWSPHGVLTRIEIEKLITTLRAYFDKAQGVVDIFELARFIVEEAIDAESSDERTLKKGTDGNGGM